MTAVSTESPSSAQAGAGAKHKRPLEQAATIVINTSKAIALMQRSILGFNVASLHSSPKGKGYEPGIVAAAIAMNVRRELIH
jgi:hypothetical protein